jgi:hypothetical protein
MVVRSHLLAAAAITAASLAGARCQAKSPELPADAAGAPSAFTRLRPLSGDLNNALTSPTSTDIAPSEPSATGAYVAILKAPSRLAAAPRTVAAIAPASVSTGGSVTTAHAGGGLATGSSSSRLTGGSGNQCSPAAPRVGMPDGNLLDVTQNRAAAPAGTSPRAPTSFGPCSLFNAPCQVAPSPVSPISWSASWPLSAALPNPGPRIACRWDAARSNSRPSSCALALLGMAAALFAARCSRRRPV